jgi:hypothetical protein
VVKIEMKIRITPEELMKMTARYLPFEIVSAGEIIEKPLPKAPPAVVALTNQPKAQKQRKKHHRGLDLSRGMNKIIIEVLTVGQVKTRSIKDALVAGGFADNSITGQLNRMEKYGVVRRAGFGIWELANVPHTEEAS